MDRKPLLSEQSPPPYRELPSYHEATTVRLSYQQYDDQPPPKFSDVCAQSPAGDQQVPSRLLPNYGSTISEPVSEPAAQNGTCPTCRQVGGLKPRFNCFQILGSILCFPPGVLCWIIRSTEMQCRYCGTVFA